MNVDKIKTTLNEMYVSIYKNCKFCEGCDAVNRKKEASIIHDRAVKIGTKYGEKLKVLIIGKESKSMHSETGETESFETQNNQHYRRTYDILNYLINDISLDSYDGYHHVSENELSTLNAFFALTNHYHCSFGENAHSKQSSNCMWYHCAEIVKKEIEILDPDIIVIQAGWSAKKNTRKSDIERIIPTDNNKPEICQNRIGLFSYDYCGRTVYVIGSYHPSYHLWHKDEYLDELKERLKAVKRHMK